MRFRRKGGERKTKEKKVQEDIVQKFLDIEVDKRKDGGRRSEQERKPKN